MNYRKDVNQALQLVADLMAISARTAPKSAGQDFIELKAIHGAELHRLARAMEKYGEDTGKRNFDRDGRNVADSEAMLLVGLNGAKILGLNCGACGQDRCADLPEPREGPEFRGPFCAWRLVDLGIALGSAVKTASILNADNRIMYRAGVLARKLGIMNADVVIGIPLAATGKNIYFDRK